MSPENARAIDQALGALPLDDRVFALVANIITRKPQAAKAVISLAAALTAMAKILDKPERIAIAEILRDSADIIERWRERIPIG